MKPRIFMTGVGEPEGPVFARDGAFYLVEMAGDRACVTVHRDGETKLLAKTAGRPNGLAIDGNGNIWVAEAGDGTVVCLNPQGNVLKVIAGNADNPFLWPNDLAFGPNGLLYLTDSGIRPADFIDGLAIRSDFLDIGYDGRVYEIDPLAGTVLRIIDRGFRFTNGLAFDRAGLLYVAETLSGAIFRYDLKQGQPVRQPFANVMPAGQSALFRGPDGIAFDTAGSLYCAVYNGSCITVVDPTGAVAYHLETDGAKPTNLAFEPNGTAIYVTEVATSTVQIIDTGAEGLPLHYPSLSR